MIFRNYNDYEIVSMIKQGNQEAFQFMTDKYKFFIAKKIRNFNLSIQYEDIFQESLMVLYKSAIRFDETYEKTFMRFFESNLINRLITIKNKNVKYNKFLAEKKSILAEEIIKEETHYYISEKEIQLAINTLSDFEKKVFQAKIIEKRTVKETSEYLNFEEKKIYNALDRIKNKLKLHLM